MESVSGNGSYGRMRFSASREGLRDMSNTARPDMIK